MPQFPRWIRMTAAITAATLSLTVGTAASAAADDPTEASRTVRVGDGRGTEANVRVGLTRSGRLTLEIDGLHQGKQVKDKLNITSFSLLDDRGNFVATAVSRKTGETIRLNTTEATAQALPALIVLGILARAGISLALRQFTKTQVKKAAKSYLLNQVSANKWAHILAPKHKWGTVGARNKEQVAELMARAMAEGRHVANGAGSKKAVWTYQGKTIEVTYSSATGHISNGWVK